MERVVRHLPPGGWSGLLGGLFRRDNDFQRANERGARSTAPNCPRPSRSLGELRHRLDNLEPPADRRLSVRGRVAGDRIEQDPLNLHFVVTIASIARVSDVEKFTGGDSLPLRTAKL